VIHHSADTRRILEQMHRVLRPNGKATVMVYHRSPWKYYVFDGILKRALLGGVLRGRTLHEVNQATTDGALARFYKPAEWQELAGDLFTMNEFRIYGLKNDIIPLPPGGLKDRIEAMLPDRLTRTFTNTLGWGSFLTIRMTKK
jgi:2-polyprenyl-3-methyl-5-hydroxy-6-metoxy-1,4-benzoquinol methylase